MGIEIFVNILLLVGAVFCFWELGQEMPPSTVPGAMDAADWPRGILFLLVIALLFNIAALYRAQKAPGAKKEIALRDFLTPKFLLSTAVVIAYSLVLDHLGFLLSTFLFVTVFSWVAGLRKPLHAILGGLCSAVVMYAIFQIGLQVMLPRGVGIFRELGIWLEVLAT